MRKRARTSRAKGSQNATRREPRTLLTLPTELLMSIGKYVSNYYKVQCRCYALTTIHSNEYPASTSRSCNFQSYKQPCQQARDSMALPTYHDPSANALRTATYSRVPYYFVFRATSTHYGDQHLSTAKPNH